MMYLVLPLNCLNLTHEGVMRVMEEVLYEFPVREVNINLPRWIEVGRAALATGAVRRCGTGVFG